MSDYLSNLVARSINQIEAVQPRLPSLFEPMEKISGLISLEEFEPEPVANSLLTEVGEDKATQSSKLSPHSGSRASKDEPIFTSLQITDQKTTHRPKNDPPGDDPSPGDDPPDRLYNSVTPINFSPLPSSATETVAPLTLRKNLVANIPELIAEPLRLNVPEPLVIQQTINEYTVLEKPFSALGSETQPSNRENLYLPQVLSNPDVEKVLSYTEKFVEVREIPASPTQVLVSPQVTSAIKSLTGEAFQPQTASQPAPTIQVTIGRIEIRATPPVTTSSKQSQPKPSVMSLEEYLRQRGGGK